MTKTKACGLIDKWRITEAGLWNRDHLDLVTAARITFEDNAHLKLLSMPRGRHPLQIQKS